jgi:hypothetical protein
MSEDWLYGGYGPQMEFSLLLAFRRGVKDSLSHLLN